MSEIKRSEQRPDTEQLILQAAEEEFLSKGFDGARTTAIAEKAGVTHAMLHYYFRTKEKLFDKVIETKTSEMKEVMFGFIGDDDSPLTESIERGMRRHFHYLMQNPNLPLFIINETGRENSKTKKHLTTGSEAAEKIRRSLQCALDAAEARGECRHVDAQALMLDIISLNVFSFIAAPLLENLFPAASDNYQEFLNCRLEENIMTVLSKLKP